ncbi:2,4-dienoyl-CoA reductase [Pseudobutyrivibrio ruminis]|uniref:2,4-dienoyl-CoA reductase n=2 Tax=Pseudobutyrivibrio ruminis TaxID=46206 RepID=A0A1H7IV03_9FIRM|nr:FAD-dependent oxidoreductase [Pseudobutyrivibrio ruminis]SEK66228.1 2,4-dienoyl-CoA reductase [Pseudobutyrivibrio ruminis]SOB97030.1 2,4-dienoyl-CoA reductase [Pseudobutyrivibrio ruminis DSM 9787]
MRNKYPHIFEPLTIRRMTLKNRIMMTPMGTNYGDQNGEMTFVHIDYYEQRAKGGTGLLMVENASVFSPQGSNGTTQLRIDHDNFIPRLYYFTERMHKHGACVGIQINHAGASAVSARTGEQPVSASDIPSKAGGEIPRPLEKEEIYNIVKKYGEAAKRAQTAGFDCVEIHAGHSYLLSQFLSPTTNKRTDEFGGSPENRARFTKLVVEEVRKQVGPFFPIFVRISADEFVEGGNTLEDAIEYLQYFQEEVDVFDVSAGLNSSIQFQIDANYLPDGWRSYMAKAVKEKYGKPCVTMGNIRDPKVAEEILERGDADIIGMGRGLIADPNWVNKVEFNREDELRKCISCNVGCAGHRIGLNLPIRCTVNPAVNANDEYYKRKVNKPCNVVVIGGGTAGLEAACTAAEVGCTTFLLEKKAELGGLSVQISKIPDKKRLADFPKYMINRASKLRNLFIFKNNDTTVDQIKSLNPDIIVNATGSNPTLPPIKGLLDLVDKDDSNVATVIKMIERLDTYPADMTGKKVAVVGGGAVGLDVMEYFTERGAEVTIIEMLPIIGNGLDPITKCDTAAKMAKYNVRQMTNTALQEVCNDKFIVKNPEGEIENIDFDLGFICLGMRSNTPIIDELNTAFEDTNVEIYNIGDSKRARRIIEGTEEGRDIIKVLERHDFL